MNGGKRRGEKMPALGFNSPGRAGKHRIREGKKGGGVKKESRSMSWQWAGHKGGA